MDSLFTQIFSTCQVQGYEKKKIILHPRRENRDVFFIESGYVRAHTVTVDGNDFSVSLLGPGMLFPFHQVLPQLSLTRRLYSRYFYSSVTRCRIRIASYDHISAYLITNPRIASKVYDAYYVDIQSLFTELEFISYTHSALKRVCHFLLNMSSRYGEKDGDYTTLMPSLTQKEIATYIGLTRESVTHQLAYLKKKNILESVRPLLRIKSLALLEQELDGK